METFQQTYTGLNEKLPNHYGRPNRHAESRSKLVNNRYKTRYQLSYIDYFFRSCEGTNSIYTGLVHSPLLDFLGMHYQIRLALVNIC